MLIQGKVFRVVSLLAFVCFPSFAQLNASLQGVITDPSGGVIPGAQVTLKNNGTNATQSTTASDQGFYKFNQLPAGTYTLTTSAPNFQSSSQTDVAVAADVPQTTNVTLQPGNIQSTVTVTASAVPTLQTADASVNGTIGAASVETLPTAGLDPYELVRTMPGINGTGSRSGNGQGVFLGNTTGPGQSNAGIFQTENQIQVSSAGQRVEQNVFYIDGVNVNSLGWGGAAVVTPNSESVQDINVISADYDAADGRGSGAHIKTTTKAGTNQLHGSGVFLYQDPNFNAYNKFGGPDNAPPTRVDLNFRQYGGSLGGPIKKDKLFLFASYQGLKNRSTTYAQAWVTTPQYRNLVIAERPGSTIAKILQSANANPTINAVLGGPAASCSVFGANAASTCRQVNGGLDLGSPGPGVAGTPYYPIYPAAQSTGGGFDGIPDIEYVQYYIPSEEIGNQFNARIDYALSSKDTLFGSFYLTHLNSVSQGAPTPSSDVFQKPTNTAVTLGYVRSISATWINELRGNFTRFADNQINDNPGTNFGIPQIQIESYPFGDIQAAGVLQSPDTPAILAQNTYEVRDTATKTWGNHTIRFGGEFRWEQDNDNLTGGARPLYSFSGLWNLANSAPIYEDIYANAANGGPPNAARYFRDHLAGLFAEDDWHVTPSLMLTLGLRWEFFSPLTEARNQLENIQLGALGPYPLVDAAVRPVSQLWNNNWKDFEPRIGFAYSPTAAHEKFVVRGGFGILYNRQNDNVFATSREDNPNYYNFSLCCGTAPAPFSFSTPFDGGVIKFATGSSNAPNSYPANPALATGVNAVTGTPNAIGGGTPPTVEIYGAYPNTPDAYTFLYSFQTQTQLARNLSLSVGYQGALSRHLIRLLDQNFLYPQNVGNQSSFFYAVYFPTPDVNASYNSMDVTVTKNMSWGFTMNASYSWSKSIDMLSAEGPGAQTNQTDPVHAQTDEYGPSDYDSRNRFVISGLWDLPIFPHSKGILHAVLGGWRLGGITTAYSGFPWTPVTGVQQSVASVTSAATIAPTRPAIYFNNANPGTNSNTCFIDGCEFGGTNPNVAIVGTNYFNIAHSGPPGIGRNSFRGPGYFSTDATLSKKFSLPFVNDVAGLELMGQAFNVFNQLNLAPFAFGSTDTLVENPNFGRPTAGLAGRSIQLEARFTF